MRAVEIREPGPPEVLVVTERPVPVAGPGEILIRVAAAGVNRPDCLQRRGIYPAPPGASDLPGLEVAGHVAALGAGVTGWQPGERICALLAGGGYAEFCAAPAVQCLPVPAGLSLTAAAAVPETFFTVWTNVFERGALSAGETLLVHGGASGIGTTAIQLGRAFGAEVLATAGSATKAALCRQLGAVRAIDYRSEDFASAVRAHTGGRGVDVILDIVGGSYLEANIAALAPGGRLVVIGLLGGARGQLDLGRLLTRQLTVTASTLRPRSPAEKGRIASALRERVWPLLATGRVAPVIQATLPLAEAATAHRILESNEAMGKLVLVVDPAAAGRQDAR
ncbi:MAG: NAD(P)H-quinone oxidoreductase [Gammaproteobacteria bacterium]|nr:NAD(P)H-quinone oxidoreductase [Gammaproteobacteria bacterium]